MKKFAQLFFIFLMGSFLIGCSSTSEVVGSWSSPQAKQLIGKKVLVITKINDNAAQRLLDENISSELKASNVNAVEGYLQFPTLEASSKLSKDQLTSIVSDIKSKNYQAIVLTTLKNKKEIQQTYSNNDGFSAGGGLYSPYYGGFGSYYGMYDNNYYGNGMYGAYDPMMGGGMSTTTTTSVPQYVLETVTYDLSLPSNKSLISVVKMQVTDPDDLDKNTTEYAQKVVQEMLSGSSKSNN